MNFGVGVGMDVDMGMCTGSLIRMWVVGQDGEAWMYLIFFVKLFSLIQKTCPC